MARYAAVDIGSNSVRMEAAEVMPNASLRILASERQVTRLGESVFRSGRISPESLTLVCGILSNMAAAYKRLDVASVRAVATAAVRDSSNQMEFVARASAALGTEVEIISGQEEARLIHLGVRSRWPHPAERFLIVDIGGGSAEIIVSEHDRIGQAWSKPLGALRLQGLFLRTDPPQPSAIHQLEEYIDERIGPAMQRIGQMRIDRVVGTSATASAVVSAVNRIPRMRRDEADRMRDGTPEIRKLYRDICGMDTRRRQAITGIGPRRAEIIVPGTAVLLRLLESLNVPALWYSAAGVRDGIIADLAARAAGELSQLSADQRRVVEAMAEHYGVGARHAKTVARLAGSLFTACQSAHRLPAEYGRLLEAGAYLHDIGHYVSDTRHHKHSYYLVANSDMPGFTEREREIVANLCRYHRKAPPRPEHPNLQSMDAEAKRAVILSMPLLRLADSLDRSGEQRVKTVQCVVRPNDFQVTLHPVEGNDVDLEIWAAEQQKEIFREVYGKGLVLARN
jgi:exopolyphosphatase/guanosine-5'-triphosphate,3'-diphosphate pyrophosphatase